MSDQQGVAVVTGGGSGIGLATCHRLAKNGFSVVVLDLSHVAAQDAANRISRSAISATASPVESTPEATVIGMAVDVSDPVGVEVAFEAIASQFGRVDVLINNAGITGSQAATSCHETPLEDWDRVMAVNVRGPYLCSKAVLPNMLQQGQGHIITVSSIAGQVAFPKRCAYTASKGAALMFAKSLAVDYADAGIRSNAVCPGFIETPMTQWRLDIPELRARVESVIPMGRVGRADEISSVIAALASREFSYVNGAVFTVDGGWTSL